MKKFIMTLLILGAVFAVVSMIMKRRSGSDIDEWRSFAEDTASQAKDEAKAAIDEATDAVEDATS